MSTEAETEFLARIRGASTRSDPETIAAELAALAPAPLAQLAGLDLLDGFLINLRRNGCSCSVSKDRSAAIASVSEFVAARHGQRRIVTGYDPRLAALPWRDGGLLPRFGAAQAGDAVAVSYARLGIAETGSLAIDLDRNNPAANNLLIEDHIILVDESDIKRSLDELWGSGESRTAHLQARGIMLISGPSSTADIGMQLVMGAHGPRALHVVVLANSDNSQSE